MVAVVYLLSLPRRLPLNLRLLALPVSLAVDKLAKVNRVRICT